jgi:hypothetical protein
MDEYEPTNDYDPIEEYHKKKDDPEIQRDTEQVKSLLTQEDFLDKYELWSLMDGYTSFYASSYGRIYDATMQRMVPPIFEDDDDDDDIIPVYLLPEPEDDV